MNDIAEEARVILESVEKGELMDGSVISKHKSSRTSPPPQLLPDKSIGTRMRERVRKNVDFYRKNRDAWELLQVRTAKYELEEKQQRQMQECETLAPKIDFVDVNRKLDQAKRMSEKV